MNDGTAENMSFIKKEELTEEALSVITEEYPYYPIAQFRLLSDYKKNQNKNFEKQALITALFFNNTRWFNRQLHLQTKIEDKDDRTVEINRPPEIIAEQTEHNIDKTISRTVEEINEKNLPATEDTDDTSNLFEPLHTVDYFASQGIKINEELTNDKLSTQLKSFTEWLKTMKKIHSHQLHGGDEQTDKIIQHIAEGSNTNTNVVTEAMAEVLVKQDKLEQAIEMYKKLSLNYPAKSAYFAAKIESLKSV